MTDHETDAIEEPDEDDHTVMVDRAARKDDAAEDGAKDGAAEDPAEDPAEDEDEHTVMVDRAAPKGDGEGGAEEDPAEDEDDHTVMVDRPARTDGAEDDPAEDEDEHTVVVDRSARGKRKAADAKAADANPENEDADDHTVVVDRKGAKPSLTRRPASTRRRGIVEPPVPAGFAPSAVDAIGPNAEVSYAPRALPDLPAAPEAPVEGPAATRAEAPFMPSVLRRGERTARLTLLVFVATCVVSVVGLTIIALIVF